MNENKVNILKVAFPTFIKETFYFECGDGWFDLIADIAQHISSKTPYCHASQIKEKFGLLRIYIDVDYDENGDPLVPAEMMDDFYHYISDKERESKVTCEDCGIKLKEDNRADQKDIGYWIRNICKGCLEIQEKKVEERLTNKIYKTLKQQP